MNRKLTTVGLAVAAWFLVNNLWSGVTGATPRLTDAAVFAVGMYLVHTKASRVAMLVMTANWLIALLLRLHAVTPTGAVFDVVYGVLWACGIIGICKQSSEGQWLTQPRC
jgi:hypothetical protein